MHYKLIGHWLLHLSSETFFAITSAYSLSLAAPAHRPILFVIQQTYNETVAKEALSTPTHRLAIYKLTEQICV